MNSTEHDTASYQRFSTVNFTNNILDSSNRRHLFSIMKLLSLLKTSKPKISGEDEIDDRLASEILSEIEDVIESSRYSNDSLKRELFKLLNNMSKNEAVIAKKVYEKLKTKHSELLTDYTFKENVVKSQS